MSCCVSFMEQIIFTNFFLPQKIPQKRGASSSLSSCSAKAVFATTDFLFHPPHPSSHRIQSTSAAACRIRYETSWGKTNLFRRGTNAASTGPVNAFVGGRESKAGGF